MLWKSANLVVVPLHQVYHEQSACLRLMLTKLQRAPRHDVHISVQADSAALQLAACDSFRAHEPRSPTTQIPRGVRSVRPQWPRPSGCGRAWLRFIASGHFPLSWLNVGIDCGSSVWAFRAARPYACAHRLGAPTPFPTRYPVLQLQLYHVPWYRYRRNFQAV